MNGISSGSADILPTSTELALYDEITRLSTRLWTASKGVSGFNTDPKMFSVLLYNRLWSNHRGFTILWNEGLSVEADVVLRAGIEAAICIAANFRMGAEFITLLRRDAAHTVQGQIKLHRRDGEHDMGKDGEETLRTLQSHFRPNEKPDRLNWKSLAEQGQVPQLYDYHRMLSGTSAHVTGLSVLRSLSSEDADELRSLTRKMHPMMMAAATLQASMIHAGMIDDLQSVVAASELTARLNEISMEWPGVAK